MIYKDIETGEYVTVAKLETEYRDALAREEIDDCLTFDDFVKNCLTRYNGTLIPIQDTNPGKSAGKMRVNIVINDDTIREQITWAVEDAEYDEEITLESEDMRNELIDACMDEVISLYELYEEYNPNYADIVRDIYNGMYNY